jgi:hypothetical protein
VHVTIRSTGAKLRIFSEEFHIYALYNNICIYNIYILYMYNYGIVHDSSSLLSSFPTVTFKFRQRSHPLDPQRIRNGSVSPEFVICVICQVCPVWDDDPAARIGRSPQQVEVVHGENSTSPRLNSEIIAHIKHLLIVLNNSECVNCI